MIFYSPLAAAKRMMRQSRAVIILALICCALPVIAGAQVAHDCLPATLPDSTAQVLAREATSLIADSAAAELRQEHGIPTGTSSDVSIVQENAVCSAAMTAFEARTQRQFTESFVIVRIGRVAPFFYLMTPRREGALSTRYLLDGSFNLIDMIGSE